jgi:glycosyltransferase involved in cell wall biosynthesis
LLKGNRIQCNGAGAWPGKLRAGVFAMRALAAGYRQRPDLVVVTHINLSPAARWLKKVRGIPYCCVAHGIEAWGMRHPARKAAVRAADFILAVSSFTRDRLVREERLHPATVLLLPNTIARDAFRSGPKPESLLRRHGIGPEKKVILTVARLNRSEGYKGYDQILKCMPRIRRVVPGAHYVLVGSGDDRSRIEGLIAALKLSDCVTLAGFIPDMELVDYYNLCDVFAMPSKGEGFGIVYLEALACGKAVLAGNADGSSEPLQHGKLGVLAPPDDVEKIGECLIAILNSAYPLPILYRPQELRARALGAFGFECFAETLWGYLTDFAVRQGKTLRPGIPRAGDGAVRAFNHPTPSESHH